MFLLLTLGCTCGGPKLDTTTADFGAPALREVTTRFDDQQIAPLSPERAFQVAARCPTLTHAELVPERKDYARLHLRGTGLERVTRVGGALPDGHLVDLHLAREGDEIVMPILAPDVEVWLGIADGEVVAACRGPGYSLDIKDLRLAP